MTVEGKRRGRSLRPTFTLRDLIWLTLVVAMALGWWMDHRSQFTDLRNALQEAEVRKAAAIAHERHADRLLEHLLRALSNYHRLRKELDLDRAPEQPNRSIALPGDAKGG